MEHGKDFELIRLDDEKIHQWQDEEADCHARNRDGIAPHKHHMRCIRCGARRYGAWAEHGAYHFFTYDHKGTSIQHETMPPCVGDLPEGYAIITVTICGECHHFTENDVCRYGHNAPLINLLVVAKKKTAQ